MEKIIFYSFAFLTVLCASMVITTKNPVRAVLFLVGTFFSTAGIWLLLEAEFLAITLVMVYVGAVMVLFLFVVMMLDIEQVLVQNKFTKYLPVAVMVAVITLATIVSFIGPQSFGLDKFSEPMKHGVDYSNVKALGAVLYTNYIYAFELAAVILVVAIIAAISLSFRGRVQSKGQNPGMQAQVKKQDRLRIVKLQPENPN